MWNYFIAICFACVVFMSFLLNNAVEDKYRDQIFSLENELTDLRDEVETYKEKDRKAKVVHASFSIDDMCLLARLIQSEAGNQDFQTKLNVGSVVVNRIASNKYPDTMKEVIYQEGQFDVTFGENPMIDVKVPVEDDYRAAYLCLVRGSYLPKDVLFFYNDDVDNRFSRSREIFVRSGNMIFSK